jgi:MFS transporter, DHA1 family, multidrug resistance protein
MNNRVKILIVANLINIFGFSIFAPLYMLFGLGITQSLSVISNSWGMYVAVTGVCIIIWGKIEDSFSRKQLIYTVVIGYLLMAIGSLAFLLVSDMLVMYVVLAINAIGSGITSPAWKTLFAKTEDKGKEASEWSYFEGGSKLLAALGVIVGGLLLEYFGFKFIFVVMFMFQLAAVIISLRLIHNK